MSLHCCVAVLTFASLLVAQRERAFSSAAVGLEIDGKVVPVVRCSGGDAVADVSSQPGPDHLVHKHVSGVHCEPLVVEADPSLFLPWISDLLAGKSKPLNFAVVRVGLDHKVKGRTKVANAMLSQVEFAALDAEDKRTVTCTLTFLPEHVQEEGASGDAAIDSSKTKHPLASNFKVTITGVDCAHVTKVGAITVRAQPGASAKSLGAVEHGNLVLQVAEPGQAGFLAWHKAAVVDGKGDVKSVTIELLGPDMKAVLLRFEGKGVGIVAARRQVTEQRSDLAVEAIVDQWSVSQ